MARKNIKRTKPEKTSGGFLRGNAGWYVTLFVVSCWMFVIGVLVGRDTLPVRFKINPIKIELTRLKEADQEKELERIKAAADAANAPADLDFYEELKKKTPRPEPQKRPESKVRSKTLPAPVKKDAKKPGRTKVIKKKVAKPTDIKPAAPQPPAGDKPYTIQAASVKELAEAEKMVAQLKDKGFPAYKTIGIVPATGIWFRVRIGRYGSKAESAETLNRLEKEGYKPILIQTRE